MKKSNRKVQYLIAACASVATITMGMSSAWPTPVLPKFHDNETRVEIDKDEIAWMLAMSAPGFIVGSLVTGYTLDKLGRRATMLWSALPYGAGMIIVATAVKSWLLYLTQFLWSCAVGMLSSSLTLYFAEISDKEIRGSLFLITRVTFNLGSLLMMCIGPFLSYETLNYLLLVLPVSYLLACWWIPESPYFYLKEGKVDAARKVLTKLRGFKSEKLPGARLNDFEALEDQLRSMQTHVTCEMRHSTSPKELFVGKQYRKAIIIATGLKVTQIMTGAMTIQQYLGLIMKQSEIKMKLATVIIVFGAVRFVVSIMPSILVDRLGRRPLLIYSYLGTGISLTVVGIYFFLMEVVKVDHDFLAPYGFITFAGIICSNIISTIGFQSLVQVISGEIFSLNVKAVAMTALSIFGGVLSFIIARGYQALKDRIGLCGVFWVFAAIAYSGSIFSLIFVPETKGKSLKEIQMLLQGDLYEDDEDGEELKKVFTNDAKDEKDKSENKELEILKEEEGKL